MVKNRIWSTAARTLLYTKLVEKFGPRKEWVCGGYPSKEKKETYNSFCKNFANAIGAKSRRAVTQQIDWALTKQEQINYAHVHSFIENKQKAKDAGFIDNSYIPEVILCEY